MTTKQQLLLDIENLLNSYEGGSITHINPAMLEFMDEESLKSIINSLLTQKEDVVSSNKVWIEQFKKEEDEEEEPKFF